MATCFDRKRTSSGQYRRFLRYNKVSNQWDPGDRGSTVVLRCCASNRKVTGSIPASVSRFFIDINSFRSHYGPGVTQPLTEMSTRSISWG